MPSSEDLPRFLRDAEFAQCLSNIDYVIWLSKQGYFSDAQFVEYLRYLTYLKCPQYACHLTYTTGVDMIDVLLVGSFPFRFIPTY